MRLSRAVFIIAYFLISFHVHGQWTTSSPFDGGLVNSSIAIGGNLLVGTTAGGVFVSHDNGTTWTASNTGLTNLDVRTFAIIGNNLFAGTFGDGVFISTNNGGSWLPVNTGLTNPFVRTMVSLGNNLLAGTEGCYGCNGGGIFLSNDNGLSWKPANNGITSNSVNSLAVMDSYLFAGSFGTGVFRSSDSGASWVATNLGINVNITSLVVSGSNLYAATQEGAYLSSDHANLWNGINSGLLNSYTNLPNPIYSLAKSGDYLFACSSNNVFFSTNNGGSWGTVLSGLFNKNVFINDDKVFVSSPNGFYSQPLSKFPMIASIEPLAGIIGARITIRGKGFSEVAVENNISIGGVSTVADTSTNDSLTFIIPPEARSSTLSVVVNGQVATALDTILIIPSISYFIPATAPPRTRLIIRGSGFSHVPTENIVIINGKTSFVATSSYGDLEVIVPDSASIGPGIVSVTVKNQTGSSPFTVTAAPPIPDPGGSGKITWTRPIRAGFSTSSMAIDSKQNLFFTGLLANYGGMDRQFFNYTVFPGYSFDSYLIKSDSSYNIKWQKIIKSWSTGVSSFQPLKIQCDNSDNVVLVGRFENYVTIDSVTITLPDIQTNPGFGLLIAKISSTGKLLWYNFIKGSTYVNSVEDLEIDDEGNIYFAGYGNGLTRFYNGNEELQSIDGGINGLFGYFAQYSSDGVFNWVKSLTQGYSINLRAIEVDRDKNIYVSGSWYGNGTFETIPKASPSGDIIIAKFDSLRQLVWLKQIGAYYNDTAESANDLALDEKLNSLYVTGSFVKGNFGGGEINAEDQNTFLARYSLNGELNWVKKMGSWSGAASFTEEGNKLLVDRDGFVYLGGIIGTSSMGFDGIQVGAYQDPSTSNIYNDGIIGKYTAAGKLLWVQHFGSPGADDYLTDIKKDDNNNLYLVGGAGTDAFFGKYQRPFSQGQGFAVKIRDQKENLFELSGYGFQLKADSNLTRSFQIITNLGWSLSSDDDWLSTNITNGKGNVEVIFSAKPNTSTQRNGTITATSEKGIKLRVNILQSTSSNPIITSVISTDKAQLVVYPNPTRDKLNLHTDLNASELHISITDIAGNEIINSHVTDFEINVKHLSPGWYFLKVSTSTDIFIRRFIKL